MRLNCAAGGDSGDSLGPLAFWLYRAGITRDQKSRQWNCRHPEMTSVELPASSVPSLMWCAGGANISSDITPCSIGATVRSLSPPPSLPSLLLSSPPSPLSLSLLSLSLPPFLLSLLLPPFPLSLPLSPFDSLSFNRSLISLSLFPSLPSPPTLPPSFPPYISLPLHAFPLSLPLSPFPLSLFLSLFYLSLSFSPSLPSFSSPFSLPSLSLPLFSFSFFLSLPSLFLFPFLPSLSLFPSLPYLSLSLSLPLSPFLLSLLLPPFPPLYLSSPQCLPSFSSPPPLPSLSLSSPPSFLSLFLPFSPFPLLPTPLPCPPSSPSLLPNSYLAKQLFVFEIQLQFDLRKFNSNPSSKSIQISTLIVGKRYRAIVKPLELQTSDAVLKTCGKAACVWIISMLLATPEAVFSDLYEFSSPDKNTSFKACAPYPVSEKILQEAHSLMCFLVFYVVPLSIISAYYFLIAKTLYKSTFNMPAEEHTHARKQIESRKRVAKTVLVLVALFAFCWLPNHILYLYRSFTYDSAVNSSVLHLSATIFSRILAFSNSCVNPFALYWLSRSFRQHFKKQMYCCKVHPPPTQASPSHSNITGITAVKGNMQMSEISIGLLGAYDMKTGSDSV